MCLFLQIILQIKVSSSKKKKNQNELAINIRKAYYLFLNNTSVIKAFYCDRFIAI